MNLINKFLVISVLLCCLTACGNAEQSANKYMESGIKLVEKGELAKARLEFKNALQIDPRLAEAFYQLALLDEKDQNWQGMFQNLNAAVSLNPKHIEALTKLGQINLLAGNVDEATAKLKQVIALDENYIPSMLLKASIEMSQQNYSSAMKAVEKALSIEADNIDTRSLQALILNKQGKSERALSIIDDAILSADQDKQLSLTMIKLSILESQGDLQAMETLYQTLLSEKPNEFWIVSALSKLKYQQKQYDEAIKLLKDFIVANPDQSDAKSVLLSLLSDKKPEALIEQLDVFIQQEPENMDYLFKKIELLYNSEQQQQAIVELNKLVELQPDSEVSRKALTILAGLDYNNKDIDQAQEKIDSVLQQDASNSEALLLKSRIDFDNEKFDDVIANLRTVIRDNPESVPALMLLAQTYVKIGAEDLAEDNYRKVLTINPSNAAAAFFVSEKLINSNELDAAEKVLLAAIKDSDNKAPLTRALTQVKLLQQDWDGAKSLLNDSDNADENNVLWNHYISGVISLGQDRALDAIDEFKQALLIQPNFERAFQELARGYMVAGQVDELAEYVIDYIKKSPENLFAYAVYADVLINQGQTQQAIDVLNEAILTNVSWQQGYSKLASIYFSQNDVDKAIDVYQQGIANNKSNLILKLQLASVYEQSKQYVKAKKLYEEVLAISPDIEPAINNLASLLTDRFESDENLKKAETLTARFKDSPEPYFLDTYAWTQIKVGNYVEAQPILEKVIELQPKVAVFHYHLAELHYLMGNTEQAKASLLTAKQLADEQQDELTLESIGILEAKL